VGAWLVKQRDALEKKSLLYWISGIVVIGLGLWTSHLAVHYDLWKAPRRVVYKFLTDRFPDAQRPIRTVLVLVDDDEYWRGYPAGRRPTKRDYLANLMSATAAAKPAVIALDFSLRSPSADGNPIDNPDYRQETLKLVQAVNQAAASGCSVVLPRTMDLKDDGSFTIDSAVYDADEFPADRVYQGYVNLPEDDRRVAFTQITSRDGRTIDSFAQAIVRADDIDVSLVNSDGTLPFGRFARLKQFRRVLASDVLRQDQRVLRKLANKIVIIGGLWHQDAWNRGDFIDMHDSPAGKLPGMVLHANYAENILQSHLYWEWKKILSHILELLGALVVGFVFALEVGWWAKALAVISIAALLALVGIFSILLFAVVFDFFIPVVLIAAHGVLAPFVESKFRAGSANP
jgi:CHASE2 domain-containing sensor protein